MTSKSSYWHYAWESSYTPHVRQRFLAQVGFTEIPVGYARKTFLLHVRALVKSCGATLLSLKAKLKRSEPPHDKTNKMICVPSEDSDQPGHPSSLIRVFTVCSMGSGWPNVSSCGQRRLIRLGRCPGWSESSLGAEVILLVLSWGSSTVTWSKS